jgi:outer membrane receptor for ferrienterochelin and colicins
MKANAILRALPWLLLSSSFLPQVYATNQAMPEDEFTDFYGTTDVVSIATGTNKRIDKAPAVTTLITAADIARSGASHLDEVLEMVPGLHVSPSTISRLDSVYSIRGIQTGFNPQVLVLLNGTEFKNSFSGGLPYTFRFPANAIERIEIIRGPGTAVYGADAFSGVINIVTKDFSQHTAAAGVRLGSFDSRDTWLQLGGTFNDIAVGFAIEHQRSDGDDSRVALTDQQSVFDRLFGTKASNAPAPLASRYDIIDAHASLQYQGLRWEQWWWQQRDGGLGPGGAQAIDHLGYQHFRDYRSKVSYQHQLNENLSWNTDFSYLDARSETYFVLFPAGARLPIGADGNVNFAKPVGLVTFTNGYIGSPRSNHQDSRFNTFLNYSGMDDHQLRLEVGWFEQKLKPRELKNFGPGIIDGTAPVIDGTLTDLTGSDFIYVRPVSRTNQHISVQDVWRLASDWELTYGLRFDDFSDFGSTLNPRFAVVWDTAHNLTSKLLYGSAFRAPSFNELFLQNNPSALGNPALDPETIDTVELAFDYQLNFDSRLALNLYQYKAQDLIDKAPIAGTSFLQTANLLDLEGQGAELEWTWRSSERWRFDLNLAWQDSRNPVNDQKIANAPGQSASLRLYYDLDAQWQLSGWAHWIADRRRAANDKRPALADYQLWNMSVKYQRLQSPWQFRAALRNLFDKKAYEPSGTPISNDFAVEGRSLMLQISYAWGF